jgi:hypothetical protein
MRGSSRSWTDCLMLIEQGLLALAFEAGGLDSAPAET